MMLKPSMQDSHGYTEGVCIPSSSGSRVSELSAMTCPSWLTLHGVAHSFKDLCAPLCHNKAVILEGEAIPNSPFNNAQPFPYSQFSSVAQSCLTLCDPVDCSMPGFPVHHQLLEPTQTHVH